MLEINQKRHREVQELFNQHVKNIVDGDITDFQMELSRRPAAYFNGQPLMHEEKRTLTYDGYTQSGKKFSLTIED